MTTLGEYSVLIRQNLLANYNGMFREAGGNLPYPFITPGSQQYADVLWDWDSWLSNVALRQILLEASDPAASEEARRFEQGCILNFLHWGGMHGWTPIVIYRNGEVYRAENPYGENMHKPVLAQHAAFITYLNGGDAEWLRDKFYYLLTFLNNYRQHHRHACGVYFWQSDLMIGGDNDPCTFSRPPRSSGAIFLNCLMFKEFEAAAYLADRLNLDEIAADLRGAAENLRAAVLEHCWDERDGFFYSVDLNLLPPPSTGLHAGDPRHWHCLIQRIGVWSGFLALWAGIATPEQADRVVKEHYRNARTFNADYGVRTLSRLEKMYTIRASGNPSCWLGPVWGISNYLTFRGLVRYGYLNDARELAEKTIRLFGRDVERFGALHEYYQPENGEPILNRGFQNWNYLVLNMIAWIENKPTIVEF
ncbi:trehalase family glycosidase [Candidatus Flexifilum breve]|uniref:MGH1-like glycoside hydrolase domain-containing protein n=1 Tax=Candidatus Flexifilum breve TaxID=3140694 RepID=UPI0031CCB71B